ncbi:MAG: glycosyltransferase family 2 protein, partial [bacterium]
GRGGPLGGKAFVVEDGATDGTGHAARCAGALVVRHSRPRGVGAALRTGFARARALGCDAIVVMGGDGQDRAAEIPRLLAALRGGCDFVQGSRWLRGGRVVNIPLFRRVTTILHSALFTLVAGRRVTDGTNGFRAFRSALLDRIDLAPRWLDSYELEPYFYFRALTGSFRTAEVPVTKWYPVDGRGYTKMKPFRDWWRILKPLVLLGLRLRR